MAATLNRPDFYPFENKTFCLFFLWRHLHASSLVHPPFLGGREGECGGFKSLLFFAIVNLISSFISLSLIVLLSTLSFSLRYLGASSQIPLSRPFSTFSKTRTSTTPTSRPCRP
jgi:hypothetical protein